MPARFLFCVAFLLSPVAALAVQTLSTGNGQPFLNQQPSLGLNYIIRISGQPDELGEVTLFGGNFAPSEWAFAHGQTLTVSQNPDLFSLMGSRFGGDGQNTFALPDLRGRTAIGAGSGPGLPTYQIGQQVGEALTTLSHAPQHSHNVGSGYATSTNGQNVAHSNMQPSLALTPIIALTGVFPPRDAPEAGDQPAGGLGFSGADPFVSEVAWIAHDEVPEGWLKTEGQLLPINNNEALFSLLGTKYGGDGRTNFRLPDLRGRTAIGTGDAPGISNRNLGSKVGTHEETLTAANMPGHAHGFSNGQPATDNVGGNVPQSNMQPSLALNYVVSVNGLYPNSDAPTADGPAEAVGGSSEPYYASIAMIAANFAPRDFNTASGQILPISENSALFSLLGTTYGGDGRVTFGLPDLRGRAPVGFGTGPGLGGVSLGQEWGTEQSVLSVDHLPPHSHTLEVAGDFNDDGRVDAADYAVWREHLGEPSGTLPNDTSGTAIGTAQYELWRNNYGAPFASATPSPATAAPEPTVLNLLAVAILVVRPNRRRQR